MITYPPEKNYSNDIDGIDKWVWPADDADLFIGPASDWLFSHNERFFQFIKKTDVCIQAGGACGMYPKLLARRFNTVYTFEPHYENFYFLNRNCPEENIVKFNAALGAKSGFICMEKQDNANRGQFEVSKTKTGRVPMMTIDSFKFLDVDFIQLDLEGHDLEAIKGGIKTIKKYKPVISIEIPLHPPEDLFRKMHHLDYVVMGKSCSDLIYVHKSKI